MTMVLDNAGRACHIPEGAFAFDEEVAAIFDQMADRSIPLYAEYHRLHTSLLVPRIKHSAGSFRILDIGASTGEFFRALCTKLHVNAGQRPDGVIGVAMDISRPMLRQIQQKCPWVLAVCHDAAEPYPADMRATFDAVNCAYVLQFISPTLRGEVLAQAYAALKPGGVLFLGQKEEIQDRAMGLEFEKEYHQWRVGNGYSVEEIYRKTEALRDSMWPESRNATVANLIRAGFVGIQETSRWLQFSSIMAHKPATA